MQCLRKLMRDRGVDGRRNRPVYPAAVYLPSGRQNISTPQLRHTRDATRRAHTRDTPPVSGRCARRSDTAGMVATRTRDRRALLIITAIIIIIVIRNNSSGADTTTTTAARPSYYTRSFVRRRAIVLVPARLNYRRVLSISF